MLKNQMKRLASLALLCALCAKLLTTGASAALKTERVTMTEGGTRTLYAVEAEKSLGWISTNPSVVEVLTQGGSSCEVRAKSGGTAIVYCRYYKTEYVGNFRQMIQHGIDYQITVNESEKLTVTFEPAGGWLNGAETKEVSGTYGTLPSASRNGLIFLGWYTRPEGGTRITSTSKVTATADHTLYAHWQVIPPVPPTEEKPVTAEKPATTEKPAATEKPVSPENPTTTESPVEPETPPIQAVPSQTPPSGTAGTTIPQTDGRQIILFSAEGGFSEHYAAVTNSSGKLTTLPEAARLGYTFLGWYTAASGGEKVTTAAVFKETTTLYAHWSELQTTASSTSSTGSMGSTSPMSPASPTYSANSARTRTRVSNFHQITLDTMGGWTLYESWHTSRYGNLNYLPTPIRNGYTFLGWYTAPQDGELVTTATMFSGDAVLYAHWA